METTGKKRLNDNYTSRHELNIRETMRNKLERSLDSIKNPNLKLELRLDGTLRLKLAKTWCHDDSVCSQRIPSSLARTGIREIFPKQFA